MDEEKKALTIETPVGRIEAGVVADEDYPSICLTCFKDGAEVSALMLEWHAENERYQARVWSHEDPDGDPVQVIPMSPRYGKGKKAAEEKD